MAVYWCCSHEPTNRHNLERKVIKTMTNPFSKLGELIKEDHKKIEEHTIDALKTVLTTDIEHYGFDNKNISENDVDQILRIVGNLIRSNCKKVYHNQI